MTNQSECRAGPVPVVVFAVMLVGLYESRGVGNSSMDVKVKQQQQGIYADQWSLIIPVSKCCG